MAHYLNFGDTFEMGKKRSNSSILSTVKYKENHKFTQDLVCVIFLYSAVYLPQGKYKENFTYCLNLIWL